MQSQTRLCEGGQWAVLLVVAGRTTMWQSTYVCCNFVYKETYIFASYVRILDAQLLNNHEFSVYITDSVFTDFVWCFTKPYESLIFGSP
jgi:hypothetical protein